MKKIRQNYCWIILVCAALLAFCTNGLTANCISIYLGYMRSVWGYTNSQISVYNSIRSLFSLFSVFAMGWVFRHTSLRKGAAFWCAVHGAAYVLGAWADNLTVFYLSAALLGFSFSLANLAVGSMLIRRWFKDKLGFALGIFSCSTGLATLLAPSIVTRIVEGYSLRTAYISEGLFIVAIAAVVFLLTRSTPEEMGLEPYTLPEGARAEGGKRSKHVVLEPNGPITKREWVYLSCFFLILGLGTSQALSNFSMHFSDCGFAPAQIAVAVSAYGVAIGLTKIVYGFAVDRFGGKNSTTVCSSVLMLGFTVVCLVKYIPNPALMVCSTALCGVGFTALSVGGGIWAAELNTPEHYDESIRRFQLLQMIGGVAGSLIPGFLADRFGSYVPAYAFTVVCGVTFILALRHMYNRKAHVVLPPAEAQEIPGAGAASVSAS